MSRAAGDPDLADDRQDEILGGYAGGELAAHVDGQRAGLSLQQALRGEHMSHLRRANAEGERAERAVRARMAVTANDRFPRLREPELRPDDVDDAPPGVPEPEELDAEVRAVDLELAHLPGGGLDGDGRAAEHLLRAGRSRVIHGGEGQLRPAHRQAPLAQRREGLGRGHLVDEVQIDIKHRRGISRLCRHLMAAPHLLEERLRRRGHGRALLHHRLGAARGAATLLA